MQPQKAPTAVVAGHICLDITPAFPKACGDQSLFTPGTLMQVGAADVHPGGCVANTGLALTLFGVPTRLIACVGEDAFASLLQNMLTSLGAQDVQLYTDARLSTSYSIVLAPPGADRMFLHNPGANAAFTEAHLPDRLLAGARLLHFGYPPLMPGMYARCGAALHALFRRAKALGLSTSMDMAAIDPGSEAARVDWPHLLAKVLPVTDFFLPSAEELCMMLEPARYADWQSRAIGGDVLAGLDIEADVAPLADTLLTMGCKVAVVKCGSRGILYRSGNHQGLQGIPLIMDVAGWSELRGFIPAFIPSQVVSATGAGDTSIAAFLASVLEGKPLRDCVVRAAATGACCVQTYDALSGLIPLDVLDARVQAGWPQRK